jgi:long-subunit acyl-CoA synthetase (AMP-forming)
VAAAPNKEEPLEDVRVAYLVRLQISNQKPLGSTGRIDDVITLANGEKTVPIPMEDKILAHPSVRGVVAFGRERTHIGIIVEPTESQAINAADDAEIEAFRSAIWDAVEDANHALPVFARIQKEMILVANPSKPLPRTGKGNIQRKAAWKLYEQEIGAM